MKLIKISPETPSKLKAAIAVFICLAVSSHTANAKEPRTYLVKGPVAIDVMGSLEWMRCSIGQVWHEGTCVGEPIKVPYAATAAVLERTLASSGEGWCLPTRKELRGLILMNEIPPMISTRHFPMTLAGSYWTSDKNRALANGHWVVNFYTGHNYGRAARTQPFAIRLVKDR
jgi:hypothetical protein